LKNLLEKYIKLTFKKKTQRHLVW